MSVEAIAYVKSLDLGTCEKARLLMYVIGENTFNDTFICALGNEQLAYEVRVNERTVRRQIDDLIRARLVIRKPRYPEKSGGRLPDALRIVGFKKWYLANNKTSRRKAKTEGEATGQNVRKPIAAKMSGSPVGLADKMSGRLPDTAMSGDTGQQVSGSYNPYYPVKSEEARAGAPSEDFKFDLEGKGVRDRLRAKHGDEVFKAWFANVIFRRFDATTAVAEAEAKFILDWLSTRHEQSILDACRAEWGAEITRVRFVWLSRKGMAA